MDIDNPDDYDPALNLKRKHGDVANADEVEQKKKKKKKSTRKRQRPWQREQLQKRLRETVASDPSPAELRAVTREIREELMGEPESSSDDAMEEVDSEEDKYAIMLDENSSNLEREYFRVRAGQSELSVPYFVRYVLQRYPEFGKTITEKEADYIKESFFYTMLSLKARREANQ